MPRPVSIAGSKRLTKFLKEARAEVARVRRLALVECKAGPKGRGNFGREAWIRGYVRARQNVVRVQDMIADAVVVKGVTVHNAGEWTT